MQMTSVSSTIIQAVGHEGSSLYVKFSNGNTYRYWDVSTAEYNELLNSGSVGKHFILSIKPVKNYEKVGDDGNRES